MAGLKQAPRANVKLWLSFTDIDIASSCHHASSSLIERHLERLKRLCICNETLRRESKFAEVAQRHSAEVSWNQNGYALDASFSISSCCHVVLEL